MALILYQGTSDHDRTDWDAGAVDGFPWLFVGSLSAAENHYQLEAHNVTRLLTVAGNLDVKVPPSCVQKHVIVDIDDHPLANLLDVAQQCIGMLDDAARDAEDYQRQVVHADASSAIRSNQKCPCILVHCASGISRSVSSIMIWLMAKRGYSIDEALATIRVHRPLGNPNMGFSQQLQVLQKHQGNLQTARNEWSAHSQKDILELTSTRRRRANGLHAQVDDLEVRIQQFRSSTQSFAEAEEKTINRPKDQQMKGFLREASAISDRLDMARDQPGGLPVDKVTNFILKSARRKLELLVNLLEDSGRNE